MSCSSKAHQTTSHTPGGSAIFAYATSIFDLTAQIPGLAIVWKRSFACNDRPTIDPSLNNPLGLFFDFLQYLEIYFGHVFRVQALYLVDEGP